MKVVVIGDAMLDVDIVVDAPGGIRWSPETDGQVVLYGSASRMLLGGAANAALLVRLAGIGNLEVVLAAPFADDCWSLLLAQLIEDAPFSAVPVGETDCTTVKLRAVHPETHAVAARIDCETPARAALASELSEVAADADAILVSDYNKGAIDTLAAGALLEWARAHPDRPLVVDTKEAGKWRDKTWCQTDDPMPNVIYTPNLDEARRMLPSPQAAAAEGDEALASELAEAYHANIVLTRGAQLPVVAIPGGQRQVVEAHENRTAQRHPQVVGAGDAFSAMLTVAAANMGVGGNEVYPQVVYKAAEAADFWAGCYVSMGREQFIEQRQRDHDNAEA